MKTSKILATVLALVCILSLCAIPAFAGEETNVKPGEKTVSVVGKAKSSTTVTNVYSVDITWGAMSFTYTSEGDKEWDPDTHTYKGNATTSWAPDVENGDLVTVTNHSNADVWVSFEFEAVANKKGTYTGKFGDDAASAVAKLIKKIDAGVENDYAGASKATTKLIMDGVLNLTETKPDVEIGKIKITISQTEITE